MLGFNHVLESSASSSSSRSSLNSDQNENENTSNECDDETNVFLKHLRKCFITTDENSYCEQSILPDLKVNLKSRKKKEHVDESVYLKAILSRRINAASYEYVKIYSNLIFGLIRLSNFL